MASLLRQVGPAQQQYPWWHLGATLHMRTVSFKTRYHHHQSLFYLLIAILVGFGVKAAPFKKMSTYEIRNLPSREQELLLLWNRKPCFPNHWNDWAVHVGVANSVYVSLGILPNIAANSYQRYQQRRNKATGRSYWSTYWQVTNVLLLVRLDFTTRYDCRRCNNPVQESNEGMPRAGTYKDIGNCTAPTNACHIALPRCANSDPRGLRQLEEPPSLFRRRRGGVETVAKHS